MKITIIIDGFPPAYLSGGPIRTITAMLSNGSDKHEVAVISNNYDLGSNAPLIKDTSKWHQWGTTKVKYLPKGLRGLFDGINAAIVNKADFLYLNSFFGPRMSIPFQIISIFNKNMQLVIAPRGEFDPGALAIKRWKKNPYIIMAKLLGITKSAIWHASSPLELSNIELAVGHKVKSIIRENDTALPKESLAPGGSSDVLNLVSLSRISPKKNLHVLLNSLHSVEYPIRLDIIGPEENLAYFTKCQKIASSLPSNVEVKFIGNISSDSILNRLNNYDLMVCPTLAENFGHVIAESLAAACPVMCADVTPWTKVLEGGGGMIVKQHDSDGWAESISSYAGKGSDFWFNKKLEASSAYSTWMSSREAPHFFDMLEDYLSQVRRL